MANSRILSDLNSAIEAFSILRPYSTSPEARLYRAAIERLKDARLILLVAQSQRPQVFAALESASLEEIQVRTEDPAPEISALVKRYCSKREPLP